MRGPKKRHYMLPGIAIVFLPILASAQQTTSQDNHIAMNSFVSDGHNTTYLVFDGALYRAMTDQSDEWDQLARDIRAVAIDPQHESVLYGINAQNQLIKSLDAGKNWITLNLAGATNGRLSCIYVNLANPQEIFVGTSEGLAKSTDAGFSWHATSLTGPVSQIAMDPRSPSVHYALVSGVVSVSTDAGVTWKKSNAGLPTEVIRGQGRTASTSPVKVAAIIPVTMGTSFVLATTQGKGVFRSEDNGLSWKDSGMGIPPEEIFHTAAVTSNRVVIASNEVLFGSSDGTHWQSLPITLVGRTIKLASLEGIIRHPKRDGFLLNFRMPNSTRSQLGYLDPDGNLIGLNFGVVPHSDIDNVWAAAIDGKPVLFAIVANLHFTDQTRQNTRPISLAASKDRGYSWTVLDNMTQCGENVVVRKGSPTNLFLFGRAHCILKSDDGGRNWQSLSGVTGGALNGEVTKVELDPSDRNILYYSVGVNEREVFRYQYDEATKQGQSVDLKAMGADVMVAEDNNKMMFTATGQLSTDGGWTWTDKSGALARFLPNIKSGYKQELTLVSFRGAELRIVFGTFDNMSRSATITVLKSGDLGSTWLPIASLPRHKLVGVFRNPHDPTDVFVSTVLFTKGQYVDEPAMAKVIESRDGGQTWNDIYSVTPATTDLKSSSNYYGNRTATLIRTVCQLPSERGRSLLVGGSNGLWKSDDEGKTWKRLGGVQ